MSVSPAIHIIPATADDAATIAAIHVDSRAQGYKHIVPPPALRAESLDERSAQWQQWLQETDVCLAKQGEDIIGFCATGPVRTRLAGDRGPIPRFAGEVYALYVHSNHWRKGAGRLLLRGGFAQLQAHHFSTALLWVLSKNTPAIALYLSMGGEKCGKRQIDMNGISVKETAIGFRSLL